MPKAKIPGPVGRFLYLSAEDDVLVEELLEEVLVELKSQSGDDVETFSARAGEGDLKEFLGLLAQTPMFTSSSLLILRGAEDLKEEDALILGDAVTQGAPENTLILAASKALARPLREIVKGHFVTRERKIGTNAKTRGDYLASAIAASGLRFTPEARDALESSLGNDLSMASSLLSVLQSSFSPDLLIDTEGLTPYLHGDADIPPWLLTDLIEQGDTKGAILMVRRFMQDANKAPQILTAMIAKRFMELASVASSSLRSPEAIGKALTASGFRSKHPFVLSKMQRVGAGITFSDFRRIFTYIADTERGLRGGSGMSEVIQMELLVARLCALMKPSPRRR